MTYAIPLQFITLSLYVLFVGFCFCDGFRLRIAGKLVWFASFLIIVFYIEKATGTLNLGLILPVPTLLAVLFCAYEKRVEKGRREPLKPPLNSISEQDRKDRRRGLKG